MNFLKLLLSFIIFLLFDIVLVKMNAFANRIKEMAVEYKRTRNTSLKKKVLLYTALYLLVWLSLLVSFVKVVMWILGL